MTLNVVFRYFVVVLEPLLRPDRKHEVEFIGREGTRGAYKWFMSDGTRLYESPVTLSPAAEQEIENLLDSDQQDDEDVPFNVDDDDYPPNAQPPPQPERQPTVRFILSSGDHVHFIRQFVEELQAAASRANQYQRLRYAPVFERLNEQTEKANELFNEICLMYEIDPKCRRLPADKYKELQLKRVLGDYFWYRKRRAHFQRLRSQMEGWCRRLSVFGFNSGKYDLNLIRKYLLPILQESVGAKRSLSIIKHGNSYKSIASDDLQFLDMTHYLAAGTSYQKWLTAMQIPTKKFFWPHEYFTSLEVCTFNVGCMDIECNILS